MFDTIAPTYDRLNHILSAGLDRTWWRRAAKVFTTTSSANPESRILDSMLRHRGHDRRPPQPTGPADRLNPSLAWTSPPSMLDRARQKYAHANATFIQADALHLPYPDNTFDLITSAFGFRNLANYAEGLAELSPRSAPRRPDRHPRLQPALGPRRSRLQPLLQTHPPNTGRPPLRRRRRLQAYLPASVERFPRPPRMLQLIREASFTQATWTSYTLGTAGLYRATKP